MNGTIFSDDLTLFSILSEGSRIYVILFRHAFGNREQHFSAGFIQVLYLKIIEKEYLHLEKIIFSCERNIICFQFAIIMKWAPLKIEVSFNRNYMSNKV